MRGGPLASPTSQSLDRVLEFVRAVLVRTVEEARAVPVGLVVRTPSLPAVWSANQLRVTESLDFREMTDLADEELAGLGYLDIALEHQASGPALEQVFRSGAWKVQRDLLMTLSGEPDRPTDTGVVVDAGEDETMEMMNRWYGEDPGPNPIERTQLVEYTRRETGVYGDHLLGVRSSDGQLVATTKLRSDGHTAQVEDVYTVPEARGRGYARALVSRAVEVARQTGAELVFITADDNDWPKLLYTRIGFRAVGHVWHFHRQ